MLPRLKFILLLSAVLVTSISAALAEINNHNRPPGVSRDQHAFGSGRSSSRFLYEFDQNRDGKITKDELNRKQYQLFTQAAGGGQILSAQQFAADAMKRHREREGQVFRRADWNGDG